ncbi:MAG: tetratricopeptide repeat protein [bacterium]
MLVFENEDGKQKTVEEGWSWVGFFFPHIWVFVKGLWEIGFLFVLFVAIQILTIGIQELGIVYWIISIVARFIIGAKGNKMVVDNLIKKGYYQTGGVTNIEEYIQRAERLIEIENYEGAIRNYSFYIEINDSNPEVFLNRGMAHFDIKNYSEALSDYNTALNLNPKYSDALYCRGEVKIEFEDIEGACKDFFKAQELGDKDADEMIAKYCSA